MARIPRHMNQHERAKQLPLVTDKATVTVHEAIDRSRNRAVMASLRELLLDIGSESLLDRAKSGSDYDWPALFDELERADVPNGRVKSVKTLAERIERPYPSLLRLRIDPDSEINFSPGQYVTLRAHGTPRAYSIANSPSEHELEFAIRRVPGGRLTSDLFVHAEVGDEVVVRGPNGHMVLDDPSDRDIVFLATGTGVAPFKSMLEYLFEQGWDTHGGRQRDVWLFLGCGWADDLPYGEAFRAMDRNRSNFHFVPALTRESLLTDWEGERDYVQQVFIKYLEAGVLEDVELPTQLRPYRDVEPALDVDARIHPERTDVYACGITAMVQTLVRAARAVGVPDKHMQFEGFG